MGNERNNTITNMKTYIVYVAGKEVGTVNASNQNTAETKAAKKYASEVAKLPKNQWVVRSREIPNQSHLGGLY